MREVALTDAGRAEEQVMHRRRDPPRQRDTADERRDLNDEEQHRQRDQELAQRRRIQKLSAPRRDHHPVVQLRHGRLKADRCPARLPGLPVGVVHPRHGVAERRDRRALRIRHDRCVTVECHAVNARAGVVVQRAQHIGIHREIGDHKFLSVRTGHDGANQEAVVRGPAGRERERAAESARGIQQPVGDAAGRRQMAPWPRGHRFERAPGQPVHRREGHRRVLPFLVGVLPRDDRCGRRRTLPNVVRGRLGDGGRLRDNTLIPRLEEVGREVHVQRQAGDRHEQQNQRHGNHAEEHVRQDQLAAHGPQPLPLRLPKRAQEEPGRRHDEGDDDDFSEEIDDGRQARDPLQRADDDQQSGAEQKETSGQRAEHGKRLLDQPFERHVSRRNGIITP